MGEYEDYSGYGGEGYDASVMDPNMTGGVDGNKDWYESFMKQNKAERNWYCTMCERPFSIKGNLKRHILNNHRNNTEVTCPICKKEYKNSNVLTTHINRVHKMKG